MNIDFSKRWDTPIWEMRRAWTRRKGPISGDIGIEIEAEGSRTGHNPEYFWSKNAVTTGPAKYWQIKPDHSLRNGLEYVTNGAMNLKDLPKVLSEWAAYTAGTTFRKDTIRTSVHYHVNVDNLTPLQILSAIVGYWLLETPLVSTQGAHRMGNLFCLRVQDAEALVSNVQLSLKDPHPLMSNELLGDNVKYAAMNLNTLSRFGSLEFRFNRGSSDPEEIERWAEFFYGMVHSFASLGHPQKVLDMLNDLGVKTFFKQACPMWLQQEVYKSCGISNYTEAILSNQSYAYLVVSALSQERDQPEMVMLPGYSFQRNIDLDEDDVPTQEYSPDETLITTPKFVTGYRKKRKKISPFIANTIPTWTVQPPPFLEDDEEPEEGFDGPFDEDLDEEEN